MTRWNFSDDVIVRISVVSYTNSVLDKIFFDIRINKLIVFAYRSNENSCLTCVILFCFILFDLFYR